MRKGKSVPVVRTIAYDRIKNFVKCNETSGTTVTSEHGAVMTDAALEFPSNGIRFVTGHGNDSVALTTGEWQDLDEVDFIAIFLFRQDGTIVNFQVGTTDQTATNQNIHFGGGDSGGGSSACVGNVGVTGQDEATTPVNYEFGKIQRLVWKNTYNVNHEFSITDEGVDVSFVQAQYIGSASDWSGVGKTSDFTDQWFVSLSTDPPFPAAGTMTLYGMVMIEFPNGFPDDLDARINYTLDQWEAGNKVHFPIYEDE